MVDSEPIGWPGLAVMGAAFAAFLIFIFVAERRGERGAAETGATRSRRSMVGIVIQGFAFALASFGPIRILVGPLGSSQIGEAVLIAGLMAVALGLFVSASRSMGRNWSFVARTRQDHQLVQDGPFAWVRHPIYVALFLYLVALAIALGHPRHLIAAVPLFAFGTWLRIAEEERLLRAAFGPAYDAYAGRVKRFVPGLF